MLKSYDISLTTGAETIVLEGESHVLKPTLGAAMAVNRAFGGFAAAQQRVLSFDMEAVAAVVAAGLGRSGEHDQVLESVFRTGLDDLIRPVGRYAAALSNAGRANDDQKVASAPGKS